MPGRDAQLAALADLIGVVAGVPLDDAGPALRGPLRVDVLLRVVICEVGRVGAVVDVLLHETHDSAAMS